MLRRSRWPELFGLAWPISTTLLVRITMRTVDLLVVGTVVGAVGVSAVGIGDAIARLLLFTALGLGAGTIATVSQATGGHRTGEVGAATTQTALLAVVVGTVLGGVLFWLAPPAYDLLGAADDVTELGVPYLRIVLASAPARFLAIMLTRAFQGVGDTRTPLWIRGGATALNIVLTILLVPGLAGMPALGVPGAAIATAIGNVTAAVVMLGVLSTGWRGLRFTRAGLVDWQVASRILRIGWPQVAERNLFGLGALPLNAITNVFGTSVNAGLQVGQRVMLYGLLPSRGVATAASTKVGNQLGRRKPRESEEWARAGLALAATVAVPAAVVLFVAAEPIARFFVGEPAAVASATGWVRVYAVATVLRSLYGVYRGAFQAGGATREPLVATAIGILGFVVGLSWLLGIGLGLGVAGVFVGVLLDPLVRTGILARWFEQRRWQQTLGAAVTTP